MTRGLGYRTGSRRCSISTNFWDATQARFSDCNRDLLDGGISIRRRGMGMAGGGVLSSAVLLYLVSRCDGCMDRNPADEAIHHGGEPWMPRAFSWVGIAFGTPDCIRDP